MAITQDALGIIYYWGPENRYSMRTATPHVWNSLSTVIRELRKLETVLLSDPAVQNFEIRGGNNKVLMWTRALNDDVYAGLVNTSSNKATTLRLCPQLAAQDMRKVLGDGVVRRFGPIAEIALQPARVLVLSWHHVMGRRRSAMANPCL